MFWRLPLTFHTKRRNISSSPLDHSSRFCFISGPKEPKEKKPKKEKVDKPKKEKVEKPKKEKVEKPKKEKIEKPKKEKAPPKPKAKKISPWEDNSASGESGDDFAPVEKKERDGIRRAAAVKSKYVEDSGSDDDMFG